MRPSRPRSGLQPLPDAAPPEVNAGETAERQPRPSAHPWLPAERLRAAIRRPTQPGRLGQCISGGRYCAVMADREMTEWQRYTRALLAVVVWVAFAAIVITLNNSMMNSCENSGGIVKTGMFDTYRGCDR